MPVLTTSLDPGSPSYADNLTAMLDRLAELESALHQARAGGGDKYVTRHHARGKLLARERIELLVDRDAPFLELSPVAAWGTEYPVGASAVTGIGAVEGVPCVIIANDPTVRDGTVNPYTLRKTQRAGDIARANRLPVIHLVESGGADLAAQLDLFVPGGAALCDLSRRSAEGIGSVAVIFGDATGGGAVAAGLADTTILVRDSAKLTLAGPPLVRLATGEEIDDEALGGAFMHATRSGLADHVAEDERDAIRLARLSIARKNRSTVRGPATFPEPPKYDPDDLLAVRSADPDTPSDPREVLGRVLDGSDFDEFKPAYGTGLCTGWGAIHGYQVGILANAAGVLGLAEATKAAHFIALANACRTPLLFVQDTTGYAVGGEAERSGIIAQAARMVTAVANSRVPHLTLNIGGSYGIGNYGMCGRAFEPRFLFSWPNARSALLGADQVAEVLSGDGRRAADAQGLPYDADTDTAMRRAVERIEQESAALVMSGRLYDDGIIDPRDTRTVLGLCLAVVGPAAPTQQ